MMAAGFGPAKVNVRETDDMSMTREELREQKRQSKVDENLIKKRYRIIGYK